MENVIGLAQSYVLMAVCGIGFEVCFCVRLREESCRYAVRCRVACRYFFQRRKVTCKSCEEVDCK
jgi:hypothetical protein